MSDVEKAVILAIGYVNDHPDVLPNVTLVPNIHRTNDDTSEFESIQSGNSYFITGSRL